MVIFTIIIGIVIFVYGIAIIIAPPSTEEKQKKCTHTFSYKVYRNNIHTCVGYYETITEKYPDGTYCPLCGKYLVKYVLMCKDCETFLPLKGNATFFDTKEDATSKASMYCTKCGKQNWEVIEVKTCEGARINETV